MMEHIGWKWWKKQEPNMEQVKLELVDIWHFGLSMYLQMYSTFTKTDIACTIRDDIAIWSTSYSPTTPNEFKQRLESFVLNTLTNTVYFDMAGFLFLLESSGMTFDELTSQYVGKNVLNMFRQEHGYKQGHYRKHWYNSREDNEHLVEILNNLPTSEQTQERIYNQLKERYLTQPIPVAPVVDPTYLG